MANGGRSGADHEEIIGEALSLSQVILAPLDALFKAQVHAARSFLSFVLQMGFGHFDEEKPTPSSEGTAWEVTFLDKQDGGSVTRRLRIPALALVPVQPLAISNAEYELELQVEEVRRHRQVQKKEATDRKIDRFDRPWFLVDRPISIRGALAPRSGGPPPTEAMAPQRNVRAGAVIQVKVKVDRIPTPAGLSKLLTSLTEMSKVDEKEGT